LRFVPQADVTALDPLSTTSYAVRNHGHLCWDTLYGLDAGFRPQPQLAEGCVVGRDGLEWVFTLRAGPRFHDGEPVRAGDAVASVRRWMVRDTHGQEPSVTAGPKLAWFERVEWRIMPNPATAAAALQAGGGRWGWGRRPL